MITRNSKIHIWFALNIAVLIAAIVEPNLFFGGLWIILLLSSYILKSRKEINREFSSPVPIAGVVLVVAIAAFLVISAVTGFAERLNILLINHPLLPYLVIAGLLSLVIFVYAKVLLSKSESKPKKS